MSYNQTLAKQYILDTLAQSEVKYDIHDFKSGASMIDVWYNNKFYVIQLEGQSLGLSTVDNESSGFDTIPDQRFFEFEEFITEFNKIFEK